MLLASNTFPRAEGHMLILCGSGHLMLLGFILTVDARSPEGECVGTVSSLR